MTTATINSLGQLIRVNREELLARWREQVRKLPAAQNLDTPTLNDHIPDLIDELACALQTRSEEAAEEILVDGSPPIHGRQRLQVGFDIEEIVAEYNALRRCIHELAEENGIEIQGNILHIVNRVLDEAIGLAVQTYATERALEVKKQREEHLAFVVHDLRTPLNAITLASDVLKLRVAERLDDDSVTQMLEILRRNARQLSDLVSKALKEHTQQSIDARTTLQRREIEIWPVVEAVIHDLRPIAETAGAELQNHVPPDLQVCADAELLSRVFQNLISNAIQFATRGTVTIEASQRDADGTIECRVVDDGSGISPELLPNIFEMHATGGDQDGSHGFGLSIAKKFIELHGGTISAESTEGVGTIISFRLPRKA
jgi:two-component system, OmpR family, phosphate regulon sensor histidine kinase PhoR